MSEPPPYVITLELDDTGVQQVALDPAEAAAMVVAKSERAIDAAMTKIQDIGRRTAEAIKNMPKPPTTFGVEFGLKLGGEIGVITKGTGEAHFVIKLEWKSEQDPSARAQTAAH